MPRGGAISLTERVRSVEGAVSKTAAPSKGVQGLNAWRRCAVKTWSRSAFCVAAGAAILGAPPFTRPHGAIAARLVLNQETPEHYRVRVPPSSPDSSKGERPAHIRQTEERYLVGRPFFNSSVAQKQSPRPISERPRRDTARRDHGCVAERD